jgi:general secretion pathway protein I
MTPEPTEERGFTLLEVLIALAILGVSLSVILTTVSDTLSRTRRGEQELAAAALAQTLLDRAGRDLVTKGTDASGDEDGFAWKLAIAEFGDEKERDAWEANPVTATVTVTWLEAGQERSVSLKTLKILPVEERDDERP